VTEAVVDDRVLVAAVAGGSEEALRLLYERYGGLTFTLAVRILGQREAAQEVVQDVFLRCWERAQTYEPGRGSVAAWLMGISRNRSIDFLRSRQHREEDSRELTEEDGQRPLGSTDLADDIASRMTVADALRALPENQRRPIELAYFGQLTQREVAGLLGLPLGTVKTRIRDGMARMRHQLLAASDAERTGGE
jgi:RNA polymerase sigma-70 factor (ECF subfamily)